MFMMRNLVYKRRIKREDKIKTILKQIKTWSEVAHDREWNESYDYYYGQYVAYENVSDVLEKAINEVK